MKVLVTGGAGYIGIMAVSHLLRQGYEVTVFDKCLFGAEPLLAFSDQKFRLIFGDVRDPEALRSAMSGVQAVVHLAAIVGEPACLVNPEAAQSINVAGAENALSVSKECGVERFVFISTCSNYGVSSPNTLAHEDSALNPLTDYAISKVLAEKAVLAGNSPMITTVLRFGTICGLSPRMRFDLLVNDLARAAAGERPIEVFAPKAWRPFLHVKDAARAIKSCLSSPKELVNDRTFNVISENCQKGDLVQLVRKHFPEAVVEIVDKSPDPRDYRVSAERIKEEMGFLPAYTIEHAFLEIAHAVKDGVFANPFWPGYSAIPENPKWRTVPC